jgi:hypothetical protein
VLSAAATLAAMNAAAAATTALAGLPPTGTPNLGIAAPIFGKLWSFLGLGYLHWGQTVQTRL